MILQSHHSFDRVADYDPVIGAFIPFSRKAEPERLSSSRVGGSFDDIGGSRVLLYRFAGTLYLQIDNVQMSMKGHAVDLQSINGVQVLRVVADGKVVIELAYTLANLDPPLSADLTAFVEQEDFDFGLFLANISQDQNRQDRMYPEL